MAQFGSALTATREEAQKMIAKAVAESSNLAEAMESVGAMYGIPSSNILVDDNLKSVKVINDTILCPSNVSATNNSNTIVRSISTLLDQISSRIDEKINDLQAGNIADGRFKDSVLEKTDPSKGKVIATHKDANGEPVIVYDSGIIDAPNTPEGRAKANELRAAGNVPAINPLQKREPSYFTDDDNITNGVSLPMGGQEDNGPGTQYTPNIPTTEYSIADKIGESDFFIDAMTQLNTNRLGQTLFTTHGYERILPSMNVVQEAATAKKGRSTRLTDLKHMKFDNKNIIKAINYLNKARAEQSNIKNPTDLNIKQLINSKNYNEAIKCIENQFDCHLSIRFYDLNPGMEGFANVATIPTGVFNYEELGANGSPIGKEITKNITISKTKGFQFGGSSVDIHVLGKMFAEIIPKDPKLFGQGFISIMLHEMFHNITAILRLENVELTVFTKCMIESAIKCRDLSKRRVIVEKYVDSLNDVIKGKISRPARRMVVRRILAELSVESDSRLRNEYLKAAKDADEKIDKSKAEDEVRQNMAYLKRVDKANRNARWTITVSGIFGFVFEIFLIIESALTFIDNPGVLSLIIFAFGVSSMIATAKTMYDYATVNKRYRELAEMYKNSRKVEEYYCDLFASMYQLPIHFFLIGKYRTNDVSKETLEEYQKLTSEIMRKYDMTIDALPGLEAACYPTDVERIWTGTTVAKKLLTVKGVDPAIKRYLEWILAGDSNVLDIDIESHHNSHNFSPEEAKDLDKHLNDLVRKNDLSVTEHALHELLDTSEFVEWVTNGMQYDKEDCEYMEYCDLIDSYDRLIQETLLYSTKVTGYKDESLLKRILLFIPRLFKAIADITENMLNKLCMHSIMFVKKYIHDEKVYATNYDYDSIARISDDIYEQIRSFYDKLDGAEDKKDYLKRIHEMVDSGKLKNTGHASEFIMNGEHMSFGKSETYVPPVGGKKVHGDDLIRSVKRIQNASDRINPYIKRLRDQYSRLIKLDKDTDFTPEEKKDIELLASQLMTWSNKMTVITRCVKDMTIDGKGVAHPYRTASFVGPDSESLRVLYNASVDEFNAEKKKKEGKK